MKRQSIPVSSKKSVASGFFVTDGDSFWFLTCAHILTGLRHASNNWQNWNQSITLHAAGGRKLVIELFQGDGSPLFSWLHDSVNGKNVEDVVSVRLSSNQVKLFHDYTFFELEKISNPNLSSMVNIFGYPSFDYRIQTNPQESTKKGAVIGRGCQFLQLNVLSEDGFSGGPAVFEESLVGIVSGNLGGGAVRAAIVQMSGIESRLFI
ncbi:trypsin-like peptidase domain-containing protein [Methylobacterium indicum]|uniref:Serine protease n=1 Tax=Methylobacterium indicum TaxID=1775910 RepID=A0A8H8WQJ6_9HYPH|nr:trypsin-like peptidase domain-containing protein [Methylobacterium indicum]BCM82489.1 hypothetical protein mvi_09500 [Methylobacterium indicum]